VSTSFTAEISTALTAALETGINAALRLDPASRQQLEQFSDKVIALELRGLAITLFLLPHAEGITLMSQYHGEPDTTLSGTPVNLAAMALGPEPNSLLFSGEVTIRGDVELGQQFKRWLDGLVLDWEELLSRVSGDVVAHTVGDWVRGTRDWGRQAAQTLGRNGVEYLQQESEELPTPEAVQGFVAKVDTLRDDMARLEARVARLLQAQAGADDT